MIRAWRTRSIRIDGISRIACDCQPLLGLVNPPLGFERLRDEVGLRRLVDAVAHLLEHCVGGARLVLCRFVVAGQHLDEHRDIGAVSLEVAKAEIVHDRAGLRDRLPCRVEIAGEPLEASDPDQAARLHPPVRRLIQDRAAAGERRLDMLRPPESIRNDVSDDRCLAPFVPRAPRVQEGAFMEIGSLAKSLSHVASFPRSPKSVRRTPVIVRLLEDGHQELDITPDPGVRLRALRLDLARMRA